MAKRKTDGSIRFALFDPVFLTAITVQVGGSVNDALRRYARRIGETPWAVEEASGRQAMFSRCRPHKSGCLWLREYDPAYLAHEAVHAANYLLGEKSGLALSNETEEAYAYYVEWLVREVTARCRR